MAREQCLDEYGPYTIGDDSLPNFNEVALDFLVRSRISVEKFGKLYGQAVKEKPYTKVRIYQMIREKSFPTDPKRRWAIAKLLQIPPVLLGVNSLDDLLNLTEESGPNPLTPQTIEKQTCDLQAYRQVLQRYWKLNRTHTAASSLEKIKLIIARLEKEALYGETPSKVQAVSLLCGYHMLLSNIAGDKEEYETALRSLNKAYTLAKDYQLPKLQTAVLVRRGWIFKERAENNAALGYFSIAQQDFAYATGDFTLALSSEKGRTSGVKGSIFMSLGQIRASTSYDAQAFHAAIKEIDKAEPFMGKRVEEDEVHAVTFDEERYYLDRAAAYLASPVSMARYSQDARRELRNALAVQTIPTPKRRTAYNTVLQAKSYLVEGEYEQATYKLKEALVGAKAVQSRINLARIAGVYKELKASEYGKQNIEVAMIEIELTKTQHPGLFT